MHLTTSIACNSRVVLPLMFVLHLMNLAGNANASVSAHITCLLHLKALQRLYSGSHLRVAIRLALSIHNEDLSPTRTLLAWRMGVLLLLHLMFVLHLIL